MEGLKGIYPKEGETDVSFETMELLQKLFAIWKIYGQHALLDKPTSTKELLQWSSCYFRNLAYEEMQPEVEGKFEYPRCTIERVLSSTVLNFLRSQMKGIEYVTLEEMKKKWTGIYVSGDRFDEIAKMAPLEGKFKWTNILDLAARHIAPNIGQAMKNICDAMSDVPWGEYPLVNFDIWWEHYLYLSQVAKTDEGKVQVVRKFLKSLASANSNMIGPKDFLRPDCPPLE